MSTDLLARARARARARDGDGDGDGEAFGVLVHPYRHELQVHCYRILGSLQDAEDALQDTLLAAWQGLRGFEARASLRTWLYRVAASRCLNALRTASRRPPAGWHLPEVDPPPPTRLGEVNWLEPCPDVLLDELADTAPGPDARYEATEAIALASPSNARATLQRLPATARHQPPPPPGSADERQLVARLARAFEDSDVDGIVALLTDDAWITMPPSPLQYPGPRTGRPVLHHRVLPGRTQIPDGHHPGQPPPGTASATPTTTSATTPKPSRATRTPGTSAIPSTSPARSSTSATPTTPLATPTPPARSGNRPSTFSTTSTTPTPKRSAPS